MHDQARLAGQAQADMRRRARDDFEWTMLQEGFDYSYDKRLYL
jgi:hypothetical protein